VYLPSGTFSETYKKDMAILRHKEHWILITFVFVICSFFFLFATDYVLGIINLVGITIISALGLQILTGFAGQISVAQAAFMAVGGYASAILSTNGIPFWISMIAASAISGIVGVLFGSTSIRIKGFYLLMVTFAAQFIIPYMINNILVSITRGTLGHPAPSPRIGNFILNTERGWFIFIIFVVIICTCIAINLKRTKAGRAFIAIRDNDLAAEVMGISLWRYKLLAFFICCWYAGLAGALYTHWQNSIVADTFDIMQSIWYVGYLIVGGLGSIPGCFFGVILIIVLQEGLTRAFSSLGGIYPNILNFISTTRPILFGVILSLFLIYEPKGLSHQWEIIKNYYRSWPFPYVTRE
jgi:branched-chain amino acid transport system permease protein